MGRTRLPGSADGDCKVGLYLRISREDDFAEESVSIANQRDFLIEYIYRRGWVLVDIYQDDGFTGTDFERPGFKAMIRDIEHGRIDTVVTKDLSRLGRDYIGTGYFLEKYFPERGIRYIAVNDGIDTSDAGIGDDMTPFRAVINDLYAKDISKKVRSVFENKRRNGKFIGSFAPYGYTKHSVDKNKLVIDEPAAQIVRRIFEMFIQGYGYSSISRNLNDMEVPCPSVYKSNMGNYRNPKQKQTKWTHETIRKILINPTYAGDVAQGKYSKVSYKVNKQINIPKDRWVVVKDTHPAIIDRATFEEAEDIISRKQGYKSNAGKLHLLTGIIYCGDCGSRMTFHRAKGSSYCVCSAYRRFGKDSCSSHLVSEDKLEEYIFRELKGFTAEHATSEINNEFNKLVCDPGLARALIRKLVDKIRIYETEDEKQIVVDYKFKL